MVTAVHLALFMLAVYGLANAIAVLKIGQLIFGVGYCHDKNCVDDGHPKEKRKLFGKIPYVGDLFYCPPCLAFWIGIGISWFVMSPAAAFVTIKWQAAVVDGLAASGLAYLVHLTAERLGHGLDV